MPIVKQLVADQFGTHIGKYSERLKVTKKGDTLQQAPLLHLEAVSILSRGVSISADALAACTERGIPIYFLDERGAPYASIYAAGLTGTVLTRREQLRAYDDERGLLLGVAFAAGKVQNQAITLRYLAKTRKETPTGEALLRAADEVLDYQAPLERLATQATRPATIDQVRDQVMGLEGNAARLYWQAVRAILPESYNWQERSGRGAIDPINSLLNYGYGILYGQVERALVLAGLDPYAGFVHADRPGKPSLVLDLIEEFRQVAVDRVVFGLANRHYTVEQDEQGRLSEATRKNFADHILQHLESDVRYAGKRHPLRQVIQMQARQVVTFVRSERNQYEAFKASL
jgi:CRISPR-associated protein Cas1